MADSAAVGSTYLQDAKEYMRFCRIRGIFLVDGVGIWRRALEDRGFGADVVAMKVSAAINLVRSMEEPIPGENVV